MEANEGRFKLRDLLSVPMQRVLKYHLLLKVRCRVFICFLLTLILINLHMAVASTKYITGAMYVSNTPILWVFRVVFRGTFCCQKRFNG